MKIATWNVNSIRSRINNFLEFIKIENPDVILLQELKCLQDQFPFFEFDYLKYNIEIVAEKGRNGVAILSKYKLYDIQKKMPINDNIGDSARYIEGYIDINDKTIKVSSIYVPNGAPTVLDEKKGYSDITKTETFKKKMIFEDNLKKVFENSIKNNEIAFYGGDYNVCPNLNMDVYSPKKDGTITNTEEERQKFKELLNTGMIDIWRKKNINLKEYSWWGYRPYTMFEQNQGYRLDAFLITPNTENLVIDCYINKDIRKQEKPSDHAPIICKINL